MSPLGSLPEGPNSQGDCDDSEQDCRQQDPPAYGLVALVANDPALQRPDRPRRFVLARARFFAEVELESQQEFRQQFCMLRAFSAVWRDTGGSTDQALMPAHCPDLGKFQKRTPESWPPTSSLENDSVSRCFYQGKARAFQELPCPPQGFVTVESGNKSMFAQHDQRFGPEEASVISRDTRA